MPARRRDTSPLPEHLRKATWLLFGRQAVLLLGIIVLLIHEGGRAAFTPVFRPPYLFLIGASILNLAFMILLKWFGRTSWFAGSQIMLDAYLVSILVYLTGGVGSNFSPLYFATILSASLLLTTKASVLMASMCTVLLSCVSLVYFFSYHYSFNLPFLAREWGIAGERQLTFIVAFLLAHTGAFYAVALLGGRLAAGARHIRIMTDEILQNMAGGVIAMTSDDTVVYINAAARYLLGIEKGKREPNLSVSRLFAGEEFDPIVEALTSHAEGSRDIMVSRRENEKVVPLQITISLLRDDSARPRGRIVILDDLSLRREMEETKRSIERMEAISEVSASIPHEVRNPLASIRGAIQEVVETVDLDAQSNRLLTLALSETDRLDKIVSEFLQFARRKKLDRRELNIQKLLEDVVALLRSRKGSTNVEVALTSDGPIACWGDRDQLHQVFLNLGLNALDAIGESGKLRIAVTREDRMVPGMSIHFNDSGDGIGEDAEQRVFQPFWSTKHNGTGLGLSLVRRLVLDHGGSIDVGNNESGGATFAVWLPLGGDSQD